MPRLPFKRGSVSDLVKVEVKLRLNRESPGHGGCVSSRRVHSRYGRQLDDRPTAGRPVLVRVIMRRFFCDQPDLHEANVR